jgi:hypothetical protein
MLLNEGSAFEHQAVKKDRQDWFVGGTGKWSIAY